MYKVDFCTNGMAKTLPASCIGKHENGWEVFGEIIRDYYEWVNEFDAKKGKMRVWGNFEKEVYASSKRAYNEFVSLFPSKDWDYGDI